MPEMLSSVAAGALAVSTLVLPNGLVVVTAVSAAALAAYIVRRIREDPAATVHRSFTVDVPGYGKSEFRTERAAGQFTIKAALGLELSISDQVLAHKETADRAKALVEAFAACAIGLQIAATGVADGSSHERIAAQVAAFQQGIATTVQSVAGTVEPKQDGISST